jgi:hypothetical protein
MGNSSPNTILSYKGKIDTDIIENIIKDFDNRRTDFGIEYKTYKKVLSLIIESLENIYKYGDYFEEAYKNKKPYIPSFSMERNHNKLILTITNPIHNRDISNIKDRIDYLNKIDEDSLKDLYLERIRDGHYTSQGGASLGFIKMARVTNNNLEYSVKSVNEEFSEFTLKLFLKLKNA